MISKSADTFTDTPGDSWHRLIINLSREREKERVKAEERESHKIGVKMKWADRKNLHWTLKPFWNMKNAFWMVAQWLDNTKRHFALSLSLDFSLTLKHTHTSYPFPTHLCHHFPSRIHPHTLLHIQTHRSLSLLNIHKPTIFPSYTCVITLSLCLST